MCCSDVCFNASTHWTLTNDCGAAVLLLQGTASVMEQNRMLLGQRGEKLSRLQEATGDLADTAAGFAEMAKKLAEQEKQKTRWFG